MKAEAKIISSARQPISVSHNTDFYQKFLTWTDVLTDHRYMVMAATIIFQTCITVPVSVWSMQAVVGFNDLQILTIILGSFGILVPNLAVLPLRYIIPIFAIATIAQFTVLVTNLIAIL